MRLNYHVFTILQTTGRAAPGCLTPNSYKIKNSFFKNLINKKFKTASKASHAIFSFFSIRDAFNVVKMLETAHRPQQLHFIHQDQPFFFSMLCIE